MPIYEYKCPTCDNVDTVLRKSSDVSETILCTNCGEESSRCLTAPGGFSFKGVPFSSSSQKTG